jgi:hypothetical protein
MPKPENILRMVTGPKSANRSIRNSRSIRALSRAPDAAQRVTVCC